MDIETGTHDHILNKPIMVHFNGEGEKEVSVLTLKEPGREHVKKASRLKQMVMRAMVDASKMSGEEPVVGVDEKPLDQKKPEDLKKEAEELREGAKMALLMSASVDLGEFVEVFLKMAMMKNKKCIVLCDGQVPIQEIHFEQMSADQLEDLALTYASFFSMPSVMQDQ